MDLAVEFLSDLAAIIIGPSSRLFPFYLMVTICICVFLYWRRSISTSFLTWIFPKSIYLHPSHLLDLKVFMLSSVVATLGVFNIVVFSAFIASTMATSIDLGTDIAPLHPSIIAVLLLVVSDFSTYWVHRLHHEIRIVWPFHSLHHSAEVMTPITVYRKHPAYDLISRFFKGILIGTLQGVLLVAFNQNPSIAAIAGVNLFYIAFHVMGSNLRHSHIWLSFGPIIEHLLISPAQHQIHHSLSPQHHKRNYGEVLAIWDWMFGTLYVPSEREFIEYGLADQKGKRIKQPHDSLTAALLMPIADSYHEIIKTFSKGNHENPNPSEVKQPTMKSRHG